MTARAAPSSAEAGAAAPSLRALLRLSAVGAWTLLWAAAWGVGRAAGGGDPWTARCRRRWARGLLRFLGVRYRVLGAVPDGAYLLATNHLGYLDILLLAAALPARFVAKREVRQWPVWGPLAAWTGTLFIDRERPRDARRVAGAVEGALRAGIPVALFAEGTSSPGDDVLPFRPALFEGAVTSGAPVVPASLTYRVPDDPAAARTNVCWWGDMTFAPHLVALAGVRRIEATLALGRAIPAGTDRRTLAAAAHAATTRLHHAITWRERPEMLSLHVHDAGLVSRANAALLRQGIDALTRMTERQFRHSPREDASPVGAHFRHVLEHYQAFLAGLDEGRIDYDARPRDQRLEQDPEIAVAAAEEVAVRLDLMEDRQRWDQVFINAASEAGLHGAHDWAASTVARELGFLLSHTIHHYALIRMLAADHGLRLDETFGVAPSTLQHRERVRCAH